MSSAVLLFAVLGFLVLMFVVAGIVLYVSNGKMKADREKSLPQGVDVSDFARDLQRKYQEEK